ncbi:NADPH-dependent F420 reductase [Paraburkholderia diazotrophica]|uniref:Reduced coenzyme F420:NADP oxidoreductase n=1 Tax=Paraburkholderia diazotrophica TaxID=667676 RepID=A0A1H7E133_9BURK|nr:NADPH-dependent F420 reductase [Paraburkholderia diazotrophica]SEK07568.1 reduced coenzyme F420:NADP oxidoreductase [Paraburkholderia diazotrophica]
MVQQEKPTIAVLGGTGNEGSGLALRWAQAGYRVIIGSRNAEKAARVCAELNDVLGRAALTWQDNPTAAQAADIVVLTVPYAAARATADEVRSSLGGKILIDATVPLVPPKVARVQLPEGGSAVAQMQAHLGADARVVAAFQNVSAHHLRDLAHEVECDVLVCGDDIDARDTVIGLARAIGLRAYHAGPICNAAAAEALTSVLIAINSRYKIPGAGIRITGFQADPHAHEQ